MVKTGNNTYTQTYTDDLGNPVILGKELARGGEGRVCLVQGNSNVVAKLYLDKAINKHDKAGKIKAMCDLYDMDIAKFSALPQRVVFNSRGKVVGFIMEKITNFKEIHNLYGISTKRKKFDFADWGFMVHSAKNLAIAVNKLHSKNIVIGDINQGNILVNNQAMIKLIDCDSYQVEYNGKFYLCEVGVPEYTSPELQGQSFNGIQRTKNHDCFGLAVMIFKILMFGRHPYSGVGAPPEIENAIKQGCYCYGNYSKGTTPIYSQLFSDALSDEVKELFDRAFSKNKNIIRPTAEEWINTLECLEQNLIQCSNNHKYYNNGNSCIWCKLSKFGFNPFSNPTVNTKPQNKPNYQQTPYTYNPPKQKSSPNVSPNKNSYQPSQPQQIPPVTNKLNLKPIFIIIGILILFGTIASFFDSDSSYEYNQPIPQEQQSIEPKDNTEPQEKSEQENQDYKQTEKTDETILNKSVTKNNSYENSQNNHNPNNPDFMDPMSSHAFDSFVRKDTPKKTVDIINYATQPQQTQKQKTNTTVNKPVTPVPKPITNVPVSKPKTDLQKSTDDFFE
ncbi:MAG: protein kinase [Candidatus Gastranaerophilales bacterium]|nr:protein kinase [Candidatus Gastranaerophilales bacterium]